MTTGIENLGDYAANVAIRAAIAYMQRHGLTADPAALSEALRTRVKAALPQALADAKEALEAHMEQVAMQTFAASMAMAGIEAAKECANAETAGA